MALIESPSFTCEASTSASFNSINTPFKQMAGIPGKLKSSAVALAVTSPEYVAAMDLAEQVQTTIDTIGDVIDAGLTSIPSPMFSNTKSNDQSWDYRIRALMKEYSIYVPKLLIQMILDAISGLPNPLEAPIPVPGLTGHSIDELFTSEGRANIKITIEANLAPIAAVLSAAKTAFNGDTKNTEFSVIETFQAMIGQVQKYLVESVCGLFQDVIDYFADTLMITIEGFPTFTFWPDMDSILDSISETAYESKEAFINALLAIEIPGFGITLGALMGMTYSEEKASSETFSAEKLKNQIKQMAYDYLVMYPMKLLQDWIATVKTTLEELLVFPFDIPFTLCDCLNVVFTPAGGFPPVLPV